MKIVRTHSFAGKLLIPGSTWFHVQDVMGWRWGRESSMFLFLQQQHVKDSIMDSEL